MDEKKYWFAAKAYGNGWGWGPPFSWQGWIAFILFLTLTTSGGIFLAPHNGLAFGVYIAVISALFIGLCLWKGEPQHTRPEAK